MRTLLISCLAPVTLVFAQNPPAASVAPPDNPLSATTRMMYGVMKAKILLPSAETMPEEYYSFQPTDAVRSYGQILGHVADSQYLFCSFALGEKNPAPAIEKTRTSKADLIAGLKAAFAYCDRAYDSMTDASALHMVKFLGGDMPRASVLSVNLAHSSLHYGNLVTYMRMKGIVPPTSEPGFGRQ